MKRKKRTEILIKGREQMAKSFAAEIEQRYKIEIMEEPQYGLVMIKKREGAHNSLFYMGEVLVTQSKVAIHGKIGIGILQGEKEQLAYWLAVIDAAYQAKLEETEKWDEALAEEEEWIQKEMAMDQEKIGKTKVRFDTMDI